MAVCRILEPEVTAEQYDQIRERLAASNSMPPEGARIHIAGSTEDGGWRIVEVWETREAAEKWGEKVMQARQELGFSQDGPPKTTYVEVHNMMGPDS
jgi:hypothetical protein